MVIKESVTINAPVRKAWEMMVNLTCWADWNSVLTEIRSPDEYLSDSSSFRCSMRPYFIPLSFEPRVKEVIPQKKLMWTAEMFGISSVHEFIFEEKGQNVEVISRETFSGIPVLAGAMFFLENKVRSLTVLFLNELRRAAEETRDG